MAYGLPFAFLVLCCDIVFEQSFIQIYALDHLVVKIKQIASRFY